MRECTQPGDVAACRLLAALAYVCMASSLSSSRPVAPAVARSLYLTAHRLMPCVCITLVGGVVAANVEAVAISSSRSIAGDGAPARAPHVRRRLLLCPVLYIVAAQTFVRRAACCHRQQTGTETSFRIMLSETVGQLQSGRPDAGM
jgi:hypothetical protein